MPNSEGTRRELLKLAGLSTASLSLARHLRAQDTREAADSLRQLVVDFGRELGRIKPLHGVNGGPVNWGGRANLSEYHRQAGFPHVRLHDINWPGCNLVDIPAIFPLFHLDADDPANYLFARTDDYVQSILDVGSQIVYRLGVSIEHFGHYHTHPPRDFRKWASICVNIIRHYNEGWANGFRHNIVYWEIWNEPNIGKNMWSGTREQYFELYETAAKAIKAAAPKVKVGGPALANPASPWTRPFLQYCRDRQVPLDFFSWHMYTASPVQLRRGAEWVRTLLDEHGFKETESHLNEWHYLNCAWPQLRPAEPAQYATLRGLYDGMSGPEGAAFCAKMLMLLQDSGVDVANYYSGDTQRWGMFDQYGVPRKVYHAFRAFNELCRTPRRVACSWEAQDGPTACAGLAADGASASVLLSNFDQEDVTSNLDLRNLPWKESLRARVYRVDAAGDFELVATEDLDVGVPKLMLAIPRASVCLVRLSRA